MKAYIIKYKKADEEQIVNWIKVNGGEIEYASPVLPILHTNLNAITKEGLKNNFELVYIREAVDGKLQEIDGQLNSLPHMEVNLQPKIRTSNLRKVQAIGWGTSIAVLDSGVNEEWISEQYDYSGYGTVPDL